MISDFLLTFRSVITMTPCRPAVCYRMKCPVQGAAGGTNECVDRKRKVETRSRDQSIYADALLSLLVVDWHYQFGRVS